MRLWLPAELLCTAKTRRREDAKAWTASGYGSNRLLLVDSCVAVHRELGPGLLEFAYQACLAYELCSRGIRVDTELPLPIHYRGAVIDAGYRIDILVDGQVIVENKSVQALLPVHEAQLLTYLKLSNHKLGFLVNWNVPLINNGIKRLVNRL